MRMVWQDMSPFPTPRMDAEEEREMRLAAQARAGAEWALTALIARYQPPVLRYLARLTGDTAQAHVLAERIFVRMERRLRGPHGGEHLRLWLLRAATETGLDALRHPRRSQQSRLNAPPGPRGLLMDGIPGGAADRLRTGLDKIAAITGSTRRQVRQLIWNTGEPATPDAPPRAEGSKANRARGTNEPAADASPAVDPAIDTMNPQEALRHRLVRAVLAELPYSDAQCLALHLVAGLNQTEVARALGIRPSAARHRIVQGLQMFAHRYDAAITSLGVPAEVAYADDGQSLPAPAVEVLEAVDAPYGSAPDYPVSDTVARETTIPEAYETHDRPYDQADVLSAAAPETPASAPPSRPLIIDALPPMPPMPEMQAMPEIPADELPYGYWEDQPTLVPILSAGLPTASPASQQASATRTSDAHGTPIATETPPSVPVLTPPNPL